MPTFSGKPAVNTHILILVVLFFSFVNVLNFDGKRPAGIRETKTNKEKMAPDQCPSHVVHH